jgi:hypothetical protein
MDIPQARIVRKGAQQFTPPPVLPRSPGAIAHLRAAATVAVGLWPLTAVVGLMLALLYAASVWSSP